MTNYNAVFAATFAAGAGAMGMAQTADAQHAGHNNGMSDFDVYASSEYGFCDAKKIASVWGQSVWEGKMTLANKVRAGLTDLADADIASADGVRCDWSEAELTYADATQLASYWGNSVDEAKSKVADLMSGMGHKRFVETFADAMAAQTEGDEYDVAGNFETYAASDYGYCDAKKIASVWGQSILDGKLTLANKISAGLTDLADADIASASNVRCDWSEAELTYADAERLAAYWGQTVDGAKSKVGDLMSGMGHKRFVETFASVLDSSAPANNEITGDFEIYAASDYGFCDAKKIASVWGASVWEGKMILSNKISAGITILADADIQSATNVRCDWSEAELTYDDAQRLADFWGNSVDEAKSKVAMRMSEIGHKRFVEAFDSVLR
ncbi:hypothetical protein [Ponticaulis sp.]|uniref:hypothetical protein n=1 Tax=Ponticaulis sp. TaxID=2020902 RepID=UPI002615BB70|nr:hypothetical protein [Ponticaulis sp.]MDF1680630.1 hypothetical protein [Ponticaulis sp.]